MSELPAWRQGVIAGAKARAERPSWLANIPRRVREDELTEAELEALPPDTIVTVVPNPRIGTRSHSRLIQASAYERDCHDNRRGVSIHLV
eukprot:4160348-Pleurochrysis_carterae.AAC.1